MPRCLQMYGWKWMDQRLEFPMGWNFHGLCPQYTNHVISRWNNPTHYQPLILTSNRTSQWVFFLGGQLPLSHPKVWMVYMQLALSVIALIFESLREAGGGGSGVNFSGPLEMCCDTCYMKNCEGWFPICLIFTPKPWGKWSNLIFSHHDTEPWKRDGQSPAVMRGCSYNQLYISFLPTPVQNPSYSSSLAWL